MPQPRDNGGAPPGSSPLDALAYRLLREAREASGQVIRTSLSAAGFGDIPPAGALVLTAVALTDATADDDARVLGVTRILGITGAEASQMIDELALRGYLEFRDEPGDHGGRSSAVTKRGRMLLKAAEDAITAARWADFPFRRGDIVVSTWPKTGTTWVQTICALLIFQSPELPAPLSELIPWLDLRWVSRDEVFAKLAAQEHRRIIKTHRALNDMPVDPRATYIAVGRHPLDSALSMYHQGRNAVDVPGGATSPRKRYVAPREWLLHWIDKVPSPQVDDDYFAEMLIHLSAAWARRGEPNVVLVHYEDLSADLEGEMRRIAALLGITVPEATWPGLVKAATFEHMRADPYRFVPGGPSLKENSAFFRSGTSGEGLALLTRGEYARYRARVAQLASPDLLAWLHRDDRPA